METVTIEQFSAIRMVVGQITSAERIQDADTLLKMQVDVGEPQDRIIVSGIAQHYTSAALVGRKCVIVANLEPKHIKGVESNGMVVCVSCVDGLGAECVRLVEPALGVPVGSKLS